MYYLFSAYRGKGAIGLKDQAVNRSDGLVSSTTRQGQTRPGTRIPRSRRIWKCVLAQPSDRSRNATGGCHCASMWPGGPMNKRMVVIAAGIVIVVLVVVGVLLLTRDDANDDGGSASSEDAPFDVGFSVNDKGIQEVSNGDTIEVEQDDFYFKPTYIVGNPGDEFTVTIKNEGDFPHTFTIDDEVDEVVNPGDETEVTLTIPSGDPTAFYCRFHRDSGMGGGLGSS